MWCQNGEGCMRTSVMGENSKWKLLFLVQNIELMDLWSEFGPNKYSQSWGSIWSSHSLIPDTQVHLQEAVLGKAKRPQWNWHIYFATFVGAWFWSTSYYGADPKGTLTFYSFYSVHRQSYQIPTQDHISFVKSSWSFNILLFFSYYDGGFEPESEHKDRNLSEYKTCPEKQHVYRWHCLQAQRKNG